VSTFDVGTFNTRLIGSHSREGGLIEALGAEVGVLAAGVCMHDELEPVEGARELGSTHLDTTTLGERVDLLTSRAIQTVRPEEKKQLIR
jgi:hypothetical protein